jgi:hypothetical protein
LNMSNIGPRWQRKAFFLLGPVLFLLQHRTVWVVMLIGMLWLGLQDPRFRKKAIGSLVGMGVVGALLMGFLFRSQVDVASASLQNSASNSDTFLWRLAGWYQLLFNNPARNPINDIFGQPFGTGYQRVIFGYMIDFTPHNYFVEAFLKFGYIGLFLFLYLFIQGIRGIKHMPVQTRKRFYPDARFWALVLLLQVVFCCTYGLPYVQTILTGVAIAGLRLKVREPNRAVAAAQAA